MAKITVTNNYLFGEKHYEKTGLTGIPNPEGLFKKLVKEHGVKEAHKITKERYGFIIEL